MKYRVIEACYANAEATSAEVLTVERGMVLLSPVDTPKEWNAMMEELVPAPYVTPVSPPTELDHFAALEARIAALEARLP